MSPPDDTVTDCLDREQSRDRREGAEGGALHGVAAPRGLSGSDAARFTRMFPFLRPCSAGPDEITALVERLFEAAKKERGNGRIPAGYTYLGQFVDHDITFDATSKIDGHNDPQTLTNFRTPRLDLDSLYGSGPADQPFLYDWERGPHRGAKLLVGHNPPDDCTAFVDLPRNQQGRALIGDPRNDENLLISQLHLLFVKFHNRAVEELHDPAAGVVEGALFDAAHRAVRWHYQWLVVHDFLRRLIERDVWTDLVAPLEQRASDVRVRCGHALGGGELPAIPVEFSAAAYRFGHSMVRRSYSLTGPTDATFPILPGPDLHTARHLGGFRRLPRALKVVWPHLFGPGALRSLRIDHHLSAVLFTLPPDGASLARLNLERGHALCLPSGLDVARALGAPLLTEKQLLPPGVDGERHFWPPGHSARQRKVILSSPPLWFYVLREADALHDGERLGPVGSRIVGEVLLGLLDADPESYLHQDPPFTPSLGRLPWNDMTDLVRFARAEEPDPER